ncbi:MAG: redoxin domain-containing protein [Planctomycetes bacterium]|nr:redoxin domain-containing protein [Planctomycetota bacterium]
MRRFLVAAVLLSTLWNIDGALADEEFDKLQAEYGEARRAWYELLQKHRDADGDYTFEEGEMPPSPVETFLPRFRAFAERHTGQPAAIAALVWIIKEVRRPASEEGPNPSKWAVEQLTAHHAGDPALAQALPGLRYAYYYAGADPLIAFFEKVIKENKNKEAAGWAMFNLAYTLYRDTGDGDGRQPEADRTRAVQLFRRSTKDYAGTPAAEAAAGYVYEIEHLQIGMKAPEIVGTDVEGREIKLSQFRGQVVVLDFWGFW